MKNIDIYEEEGFVCKIHTQGHDPLSVIEEYRNLPSIDELFRKRYKKSIPRSLYHYKYVFTNIIVLEGIVDNLHFDPFSKNYYKDGDIDYTK